MYGGNAGRIYNPQVDPLERGPPKRVLRDETHIGEMVAASKKRISWRFTLGESDTVHEVVLTHSIMSYKKLVEYDGRQMHFSSTATPGDWHYTMVLDGLNTVFEVRINDIESLDIPKYDFLIDRVPFRRWDVYRRKKQPITTGTYAQPNAQPSGGYGQHKWGPAGAVPPSHDQGQRRSFTGAPSQYDQGQRGSFTGAPSPYDQGQRGSFTGPPPGNRTRSFSGNRDPQQARARSSSGHQQQWGGNSQQYPQEQTPAHYHERSSLPERPTPASFAAANSGAAPPPAPAHHHQQRATAKKQPVINLIDDFGPSVSVSAQSLLFDPLAGSKSAQPPNAANANGQAAYQPPQQAQAPAQVQPVQQPYVDPFASSAPLKPTTAPMSLDPFANQRQQYVQQPQQQPHAPQQFQQPPRPMGAAPMQPQLAGQTTRSSLTGGYPAPAGMGQANFNISQLMNPVALSGAPATGQPKSINIDPFAGMSR